jgi:hypothetical protein
MADRTLPYTRVVAAVILPFLVVAFVILYLLPGSTAELFAWTIQPPMSAMFLGAAYAGGIWFFVQVLRGRPWHTVARGFPAVFVFATLLGIATLLHQDRFHHGHPSFIVWSVLYATTPFLVLVAMILNRRQDPRTPSPDDVFIPPFVRYLLAAVGMLAFAAGVWLFLAPQAAIQVWGWTLTPLTARVTGAILTLPGSVDVWMLVDARWSSFRLLFQAQLASLVLILGAVLARRDDLDWNAPAATGFMVGMLASLAVYLAVYVWAELRTARARRAAAG